MEAIVHRISADKFFVKFSRPPIEAFAELRGRGGEEAELESVFMVFHPTLTTSVHASGQEFKVSGYEQNGYVYHTYNESRRIVGLALRSLEKLGYEVKHGVGWERYPDSF